MKIELRKYTRTAIVATWNEGNLKRSKKIADVFDNDYLAQEIRFVVEKHFSKKV